MLKSKVIPSRFKRFFIQSQKADPSPPLGTVLGNCGIILLNFVMN